MKVFVVVIIVLYVVFLGVIVVNNLTTKEIKNIQSNAVVQIDRTVRLKTDPSLQIACEKATFDYEKRIITVEKVISFKGTTDKWVVEKIEVKDNKLIIHIPSDNDYEIRIGPQFHLLPKISK
jgi:uncharacterized protein YpmB